MIRVAFRYNDERIFARLVTLVRGGDSAHCEISHIWRGDFHTCTSASFMDGGVRQKQIPLTADKWRIYEIDFVNAQDVTKWFEANHHMKYDVIGLLGFIWRRVEGSMNRWFCSEAVADIMKLPEPHLFDLRSLESVCARFGKRIQ
jgi:hypothetical protein